MHPYGWASLHAATMLHVAQRDRRRIGFPNTRRGLPAWDHRGRLLADQHEVPEAAVVRSVPVSVMMPKNVSAGM